jgi:hypothetical protein
LLLAFALAAVVERSPDLDLAAQRWFIALFMIWAPALLIVVRSPVRWLGNLLRSEGAVSSGIRYDRELTRLESVMAWYSALVALLASASAIAVHRAADDSTGTWIFTAAVLAALILEATLLVSEVRTRRS